MNRYLLNISYIGTKFRGIQKTVNKSEEPRLDTSTVQGSLELALKKLYPINNIDVTISSRTDAGVHAVNSAVHVDLERRDGNAYKADTITKTLNKLLRKNDLPIRIIETTHVPDNFHSRYNAKARTYLYRIAVCRQIPDADEISPDNISYNSFLPIEEWERCYFIHDRNFDVEKLLEASKLLHGRHDFRTFMNVSRQKLNEKIRSSIRSIDDINVTAGFPITTSFNYDLSRQVYNYWDIKVTGRSFLYKQVRRIVGTLVAAARGKITLKNVYEMLTIPSKNSWLPQINVAPAFGLYLCKVHYDANDLKFSTKDFKSN